MKRQLFLSAAFAILAVGTLLAQGIVRTGIYTEGNRVQFVRPATHLYVSFDVEHTEFVPGEFARYAQSMLGVRASLAARSSVQIKNVVIAEGKAVSVQPDDATSGVVAVNDLPAYRVENRAMTLEQQAQAAADMIFSLRRHRRDLVTGEMGENVFGAGLRSALDEIDRMERECLELFYGKSTTTTNHYLYPIDPRSDQSSYMLCRFRDNAGVLALDDLSGDAVMLTITPAAVDMMGARIATEKDKSKAEYAFPAECKCTLTCGTTIVKEAKIDIYQFGKVATIVLP